MSFDVNGVRSPIPPDKPPQISENSSSLSSRLEKVNEGSPPGQSNQLPTLVSYQKKTWKQILEEERQSAQGRSHVQIKENVGTSSSLRGNGNQNQEIQSPTIFNQALNAKENLGIASQILGISSQKFGVPPISGNSSLIVGGNEQIQAVQNIQGSYGGVQANQDEQLLHNDEGRFDSMFPTIHQGEVIRNQRRSEERHQQPTPHVSVEYFHRTDATFSDAQSRHNSWNQQSQTWSQILSIDKSRYALQKKNMSKSNNKIFISRDVIERGSVLWKDVIVGYFYDASFGFRYVERFLRNKWRLKGSLKINADKKLFYLRFSSDEDRKQVLEGGPIFINGKVFVLREWNANIEVEKMSCKSIPIWVRFWDIPKFLWNSEGFSNLGSCIGTPLFTDSKTMEWERVGYARMCIEVDTSFDFPDKLHFESEILEFSIDVEYQWIPIKCRNCRCFGHYFHQCMTPTRRNEEVVLPNDKNDDQSQEARINVQDVAVTGSEQDEHLMNEVTGQDTEKEIGITLVQADQTKVTVEGVVQQLNPEAVSDEKNENVGEKLDDKSDDMVSKTNHVVDSSNKENNHQENNNQTNKEKEGVNKNGRINEGQDQNNETDKIKAPRRILGRHEVTHIQKDRNIRERTRSGVIASQEMEISQSNVGLEEYDEDGESEEDETGIWFEDKTPRILRNYENKGVDKHKKTKEQNSPNNKVKRGGTRNRGR